MKYSKIAKYLGMSVITLSLLYSCKKIKTDEAIGDGGQQIIRIMKYGSREAAPFSASALTLDLTLPTYDFQFVLEYSSSQVPTSDVTVTLGYDAAALAAYNASVPPGGIIYQPLTATQYTIPVATTKIRAGQAISDPFTIRFFPNQLDPSKSYMIPITITNISGAPAGVVKAPASSTAYLHIIGNPLAGNYTSIGIRYNYTGTVGWAGPAAGLALATAPDVPPMGNPAGGTVQTTYNLTKAASPVDAQTIIMNFGNVPDPVTGGLATYLITGNATFSSITYDFPSTFNGGYSNINKYVRAYTAPSPTQKAAYRLITHYNNATGGSGSDRIVDESLRQQ